MSIDVTFKPVSQTVVAGAAGAAVQPVDTGAYLGVTTFRIRCTTAGYLRWGSNSPTPLAAAAAPVAGTPQQSVIGMAANGVIYLEVPAASFFRSDATGVFEITPGTGGSGG